MEKKQHIFRPTYRAVLYTVTLLSFLTIVLFLLFFVLYAPGNYPLEGLTGNTQKTVLDVAFALLLLVNDVCVILSLLEFLKICYQMVCKHSFEWKQMGNVIASTYPVIVILFLCGWQISVLAQYFVSPFRILFGF